MQKGETKTIEITFISLMVKKYEMVRVVDVDGVGNDMRTIPIKAEYFYNINILKY